MNREQKKPRFNLVDGLILLVVLAILAAAAYLITTDLQSRKSMRQAGNASFTVRISAVDEEALPLIAEGVTVKDSVTGNVIGKIASVKTEKTKHYGSVAVPSGKTYTLPVSEYEDKYDVYAVIYASATVDSRGIIYVGNTKVLVGSTVYFSIPSFASVSYITEFSPITKG